MKKRLILGGVGGSLYVTIELLWRHGHTHWIMFFIGGLCFVLIGSLPQQFPLPQQMVLASMLVTGVEFLAGAVLNLWLGLRMWDYSHTPLNLMGQICLPYLLGWFALSLPAIILEDYLRYWLFGEEKPHYRLQYDQQMDKQDTGDRRTS